MKFADYVSDRKVKLSPTWHTTLQKNVDCPALQHRPATHWLAPRASSILQSLDYHIAAQRSGPSPGQRPLRTRASVQHGVQTSEVERVAKPVQKVHPSELCSGVCVWWCALYDDGVSLLTGSPVYDIKYPVSGMNAYIN